MVRWHDPVSQEDILLLYHQSQHDTIKDIPLPSTFDTYGGFTRPDNMLVTDSGVALASFIGSDNTGPPLTTWEVKRIFNKVCTPCSVVQRAVWLHVFHHSLTANWPSYCLLMNEPFLTC